MTNNIPQELSVWPPQFTVRKSLRVKSVKLFISQQHGLEIVIPQHRRQGLVIENLLNLHRDWIIRTMHRYGVHNKQLINTEPLTELNFPAFNELWKIQIHSIPEMFGQIKLRELPDNILQIFGDSHNKTLVIQSIRKWLNRRGKILLLPKLAEISEKIQLPYYEAKVRYQKTRWGSCSVKKLISLNHKLLFMPETVIRYVMIHELCHTVHMNHANRFWQLVEKFDNNYKLNRRELRFAGKYIPMDLY